MGTGNSIKVMSYNIRCDIFTTLPGDDDYWLDRRLILLKMLEDEDVDILGVQELMQHQITDILHGLPKTFTYVGEPRDKTISSERCAIFYNTEKFRLIGSGTFWLSDTPDIVGSITWNNECPRIVTWATFMDGSGDVFTVANTHFDHISEESRIKSAKMVVEVFRDFDNLILLGDFNLEAAVDSEHYRYFIDAGFKDTCIVAEKQADKRWGTWPNYKEPVENSVRMDWLLCSQNVVVLEEYVNTFSVNGKYASDHLPVVAKLELRKDE